MNEYPADFTISVIPVLAVVALLLAAVALALARRGAADVREVVEDTGEYE